MQEVFEKIIEKLKSETKRWENSGTEYKDKCEIAVGRGLRNAIEIVKQEAENLGNDINVGSNGWIPVEEELPETDEYILLSFSNFSVLVVGRYEEDKNGGAFYIGDEDETCVQQDMYVNAWMPLPDTYQPKGE